MPTARKKVNFYLNEEVYNFFKQRSEETGVPMSALMLLGLEQYVQSFKAMNTIGKMKDGHETENPTPSK